MDKKKKLLDISRKFTSEVVEAVLEGEGSSSCAHSEIKPGMAFSY